MEPIDKHDPYALTRAFAEYEDAVHAFSQARLALDKAGAKMDAAQRHLRKFIDAP